MIANETVIDSSTTIVVKVRMPAHMSVSTCTAERHVVGRSSGRPATSRERVVVVIARSPTTIGSPRGPACHLGRDDEHRHGRRVDQCREGDPEDDECDLHGAIVRPARDGRHRVTRCPRGGDSPTPGEGSLDAGRAATVGYRRVDDEGDRP